MENYNNGVKHYSVIFCSIIGCGNPEFWGDGMGLYLCKYHSHILRKEFDIEPCPCNSCIWGDE